MFSWFFILLYQTTLAEESSGGVLIRLGGEIVPVETLPVETTVTEIKPISLDLVNADIHSVVRLFATHTGHNFVIAEGVEGKVSVRLQNVPWNQALEAILFSQRLVAVEIGEIILIQEQ